MKLWVVDYTNSDGYVGTTNVRATTDSEARTKAKRKLGKQATIMRIVGIGNLADIATAIRNFK